ncbi:protein of unknown function [Aminobacter niigataensis]|nr:protein of unknown function [Aminobacter niigataensis]
MFVKVLDALCDAVDCSSLIARRLALCALAKLRELSFSRFFHAAILKNYLHSAEIIRGNKSR